VKSFASRGFLRHFTTILKLAFGIFLVPILLLLGYLFTNQLSNQFAGIILGYIVISSLYTFWLKKVVIADTLVLATLYTGRLLAGGIATDTVLSTWLIAFTAFFFMSLATVKRCSELIMLEKSEKTTTLRRGYLVSDNVLLAAFGVASGYVSVLVFALYINTATANSLYPNKEALWLFAPLLLYWINRVWLLTNRGQMTSDPIIFVVKDKVSWLVACLTIGIVMLATLVA